jgi:Ca2+-binding RTX toxin-like protein
MLLKIKGAQVTFHLSTITSKVKSGSSEATVAIDIKPPIFYEETTARITLTDAEGNITGYDDVASGYGYTSTTHYDVNLNYLGSDFVNNQGYRSTTKQTTVLGADGKINGFLVFSSGGDDQSHYTSHEEYNSDWNLIRSEYSDSSGYQANSTQTTLTDVSGKIIGYETSSSGGDAISYYESQATYDGDWNVISSTYSDSSGYRSSTVQTNLTNESGKITGYETASTGTGESFNYTSLERYDASYNLISSDYSDSNGYHATYLQESQLDSGGAITGFMITSSWSADGSQTYKSIQHYDANWILLSSEDSGQPDLGPDILPIVEFSTADKMISATAAANTTQSDTQTHIGKAHKADVLRGGDGNDVFVVDDKSDRVIDAHSKGNDTIVSSSFNLNLGNHNYSGVENASVTGNEDLKLIGNNKSNLLSGNAGDNRINGKSGEDTLFGGAGKDTFVFNTKLNGTSNVDTITDFITGSDNLYLSKKVFKAYKTTADLTDNDFSTFNSKAFVPEIVATATTTLSTHFIFDIGTGNLYYDADGNKANGKEAVLFATLTGVVDLTAGDLHIV